MKMVKALEKLEKIVDEMENETDIEKAVKLYKEGIDLALNCNEILKKCEGEVKVLKEKADKIFLEDME